MLEKAEDRQWRWIMMAGSSRDRAVGFKLGLNWINLPPTWDAPVDGYVVRE